MVASFAPDDKILFSSGPCLRDLENVLGGHLVSLTVPPSAPPESPRAVIRGRDATLHACFSRFELFLTAPAHIRTSFALALDYARTAHESVFRPLLETPARYGWAGIVAHLEFPSAEPGSGALGATEPVFDRMVNVFRRDRGLASFQIQFGFNEGEFNRIYTLSGFEERDQTGKLLRDGVRILLDVNNRPRNSATTDPLADLGELLDFLGKSFDGLEEELNLEGLSGGG